MFFEIFFAFALVLYIYKWFSKNTEDDPMQYPYHSKQEILYYKKEANKNETSDKMWEKMLSGINKRKEKLPKGDKLELNENEYAQIRDAMMNSARCESYKNYYWSMIEDNVSIITGKKTIAEVDESCDVMPKDYCEKGEEYTLDWIKRNDFFYKIKS